MARTSSDHILFLRNSIDIERVKKHGRRVPTPLFNLLFLDSEDSDSPHARIGIVVGRRFGKAVSRNRAKRIFRELTRWVRDDLVCGKHVLVFPRREALTVSHLDLKKSWIDALRHERLLKH